MSGDVRFHLSSRDLLLTGCPCQFPRTFRRLSFFEGGDLCACATCARTSCTHLISLIPSASKKKGASSSASVSSVETKSASSDWRQPKAAGSARSSSNRRPSQSHTPGESVGISQPPGKRQKPSFSPAQKAPTEWYHQEEEEFLQCCSCQVPLFVRTRTLSKQIARFPSLAWEPLRVHRACARTSCAFWIYLHSFRVKKKFRTAETHEQVNMDCDGASDLDS